MLGCYQCQKQFMIDDVEEMSVDNDGNPEDMICPHCGVDSVIEQKEDQSDDFKIMLNEMYDKGFATGLKFEDWPLAHNLRDISEQLNHAFVSQSSDLIEYSSNWCDEIDGAFNALVTAIEELCVSGKHDVIDAYLACFHEEKYLPETIFQVLLCTRFLSDLIDNETTTIRLQFHKKLYERAKRRYPDFWFNVGYE